MPNANQPTFKQKAKPFAWGAGLGAIAGMIFLAQGLGYSSEGTDKKLVYAAEGEARLAVYASNCAREFATLPNAADLKAKMAKASSSWDRRDIFPKALVTPPGDTSPDARLAGACAELVLAQKA